jgi:copper chaperone CopZ
MDDRASGRAPEPQNGARPATAELELSGMHCAPCASLIEETLIRYHGVSGASVDLAAARGRVGYDQAAVRLDELCAAIAQAGYGASPTTENGAGSQC